MTIINLTVKTKLRGLSPRANFIDLPEDVVRLHTQDNTTQNFAYIVASIGTGTQDR
jgi:hypothetical protein